MSLNASQELEWMHVLRLASWVWGKKQAKKVKRQRRDLKLRFVRIHPTERDLTSSRLFPSKMHHTCLFTESEKQERNKSNNLSIPDINLVSVNTHKRGRDDFPLLFAHPKSKLNDLAILQYWPHPKLWAIYKGLSARSPDTTQSQSNMHVTLCWASTCICVLCIQVDIINEWSSHKSFLLQQNVSRCRSKNHQA